MAAKKPTAAPPPKPPILGKVFFTLYLFAFVLVFAYISFIAYIHLVCPSPAELTKMVQASVKGKLGGTVFLDKVQIRLFPLPYLQLEHLQVQRLADMDIVIQVPEAQADLDFAKLIKTGDYYFKSITLTHPWLFLQKNVEGLNVLDRNHLPKVVQLLPNKVGKIICKDAGFVYQDQVNRLRFEISGLNLSWIFTESLSQEVEKAEEAAGPPVRVTGNAELKAAAAKLGEASKAGAKMTTIKTVTITQIIKDGVVQLNKKLRFPISSQMEIIADPKKQKLLVKDGVLTFMGIDLKVSAEFGNAIEVPVYYITIENEAFFLNDVLKKEPYKTVFPNSKLKGEGSFKLDLTGELTAAPETRMLLRLRNIEFLDRDTHKPFSAGDINLVFHDPKLELMSSKLKLGLSDIELNVMWPYWYRNIVKATFDSEYLLFSELQNFPLTWDYLMGKEFKVNAQIDQLVIGDRDIRKVDLDILAHADQTLRFDLKSAALHGGPLTARSELRYQNPAKPELGYVLHSQINAEHSSLEDIPFFENMQGSQPVPNTKAPQPKLHIDTETFYDRTQFTWGTSRVSQN